MHKLKYLKYKSKYIRLKNMHIGAGSSDKYNDITKFINTVPFETILLELPKRLYDNITYCDKIIGKGMIGEVIESAVGKTINVKINKTTIHMPVVIKKANIVGSFDMKIIDDILYIYCYKDLTAEAIIMVYLSDLWQKKLSPHLPFMIGYSSCATDKKIIIDKIITERQGFDQEINIDIVGLYTKPFAHPDPDYDPINPTYKSNFATLRDLFNYILMHEKDGKLLLPNGQKCNAVKLCDYLAIGYLHTCAILAKHGITLLDMHLANIFVHWLNLNSYLGDKYIGDTKYIIYKLNDGSYLQIKTYGFILKMGDVGASIVQPRSDVYILGQAVDLHKTRHLIKQITEPSLAIGFLYYFKNILSYSLYQKTVIHQIISEYPYSELALGKIPLELIDIMEEPMDILKKFSVYMVDKPNESVDTLIV